MQMEHSLSLSLEARRVSDWVSQSLSHSVEFALENEGMNPFWLVDFFVTPDQSMANDSSVHQGHEAAHDPCSPNLGRFHRDHLDFFFCVDDCTSI